MTREIERPSYLEQLERRRMNGMVKVVTGLRRCGKSYLLFNMFFRRLVSSGVPADHIITVPLDDDEYEELRDRKALRQYIRNRVKDENPYYVLLDEIQFVEGFSGLLNGLLRTPNLDLYVTGSNSRLLSSDVLTEFRGRGDEVRVRPLTFGEFLPACGLGPEAAWRAYLAYGGMPLVLSRETPRDKEQYLKDLFRLTYLRDVQERYGLRGDGTLDSVVNVLASSAGSLTNPHKLAGTFTSNGYKGVTDKTIARYIGHLKDAFLIERAEQFDVKGKKYITTQSKYYFADVGLRNARLNFRQQEPSHLMENVIYNELCFRGYSVDVGVVPRLEAGKDGKAAWKRYEIDFVCNRGSRRLYVQSAWELPDREKTKQESRSLILSGDSFQKIIVVGSPVLPWQTEEGIAVVGVQDFLTKPELLDF
ncbi:MAG: ATP-binding protein [Sutterellaceae bacterium]|nr:ATP-binding protein [Sutterellaceae bacterium]MDY2868692.1 ATP-binding protein [Mesosutterella sp.]